jgi:hypothetical protein
MSLRHVRKRVSEVGGDQASEGWQRVVGYNRTASLCRRPAKHREQGSGLFHWVASQNFAIWRRAHQHLGKTKSDRRPQARRRGD